MKILTSPLEKLKVLPVLLHKRLSLIVCRICMNVLNGYEMLRLEALNCEKEKGPIRLASPLPLVWPTTVEGYCAWAAAVCIGLATAYVCKQQLQTTTVLAEAAIPPALVHSTPTASPNVWKPISLRTDINILAHWRQTLPVRPQIAWSCHTSDAYLFEFKQSTMSVCGRIVIFCQAGECTTLVYYSH
jgi:hypothetical protein